MSDGEDDGRDAAQAEETIIEHIEPSLEAEAEFNPFSEVQDDYKPGPALRSLDAEGLPVTADQTGPTDIPPLSTETLVCMGDESVFVLRTPWGDVLGEFQAGEVLRSPLGFWLVPLATAIERCRGAIATWRERRSPLLPRTDGEVLVILYGGRARHDDWVEVTPLRPPCKHYVRQLGQFDKNPENRKLYRLCAARRTTEGTFMTVSDVGLWACSMREPRHLESEALIETMDEKIMHAGRIRQPLPLFQPAPAQGPGGIFDGARKE